MEKGYKDMNIKLFRNKKIYIDILVIIPILAMTFLAFNQLGNREMWYDEAHNVALAKNLFQYGYPRVWNGQNLISYYLGSDFYYNFFEMHLNWLPYYIAFFGMLFSKSLFSIRFAFVVMGLLSSLFLYLFTKKITNNKLISLIALWMYCLSAPVIVYIKTAYYYSPSLLFILMTVYYFSSIYFERKKSSYIMFSLSMIFLYYTNYLFFGILLIVLLLCVFIYQMRNFLNKSSLMSFLFILAIAGPFQLLKLYYYRKFGVIYQRQDLNGLLLQLPGQIWQLQTYFFPFITFGIYYLVKKVGYVFFAKKNITEYKDNLVVKNRKQNPFIFMMVTSMIFNCVFISYFTYDYATRYLLLSIPFCFVLGAIMIYKLFEKDKILLFLMLLFLITTDHIHKVPYYFVGLAKSESNPYVTTLVKPPYAYYLTEWHGVSFTLEEYIKKYMHLDSGFVRYVKALSKDYDCADEGVVKFLSKYSEKGDSVLNLSSSLYQVIYYLDVVACDIYTAPDHILMDKDRYVDEKHPYKYNQNLKYFNLIYKPIQYTDWVVVNSDDLNGSHVNLKPILEERFEKYDLIDYPCTSFILDPWAYTYETNLFYPKVIVFRNKITKDDIDCPNIVTKAHLEQ